jgi:type I restriction enzyme S subunit
MVINMEKTLKPALRFKGFTDAWEQHKLGDLGKTQSGIGFPDSEQGGQIGIPFYKVSDMNTEGNEHEMVTANHYVTIAQIARRGWKPIDVVPAIMFAKVGAAVMLNRKRLITKPFLLDNNTMAYSFGDSLDTSFGKSLFDTIYLPSLVQVGALPSYNATDINGIEVKIPKLDEQSMIGSAFDKINNLITLHQRKHDKFTNIKKALLDKMFPKNGELVPELRFKGFTDTWEQRELRELGSVAMNKRIFKDQTTVSGDVPFYKIGTFGSSPDAYITRNLFEEYKSKYPYPEIGDILISASGSIGRTVEYKGKDEYFQDSNIVWLKHNDEVENLFLKHFYSVVKWSGLEGSTIQRLYNKNILDTHIKLPDIEEQKRVGGFLDNLDNLITLHQRKYEKLVNIKKALLKKMFV